MKKADDALQAKQETIDLQDKALSACYQDSQRLQIDLSEQLSKNQSIWANPLVDVLIGTVIGGLAWAYLSTK